MKFRTLNAEPKGMETNIPKLTSEWINSGLLRLLEGSQFKSTVRSGMNPLLGASG